MLELSQERTVAPDPRLNCSEAEWKSRLDLAACYRLCAKFGMTDIIYTHLSARVPDNPSHFLINANGLMFDEITASNLIKIDLKGEVITDLTGLGVLPANYAFHSTGYDVRQDAMCIMHTHTNATIAVGAQECGVLPISQHAMRLFGTIGYFDYSGFLKKEGALRGSEGEPNYSSFASVEEEHAAMKAAAGENKVLMLRNHGVLVFGESVHEAFILSYYLEKACVIQLTMQSAGVKFIVPDVSLAEKTANAFKRTAWSKRRDWAALLRMLDRDDPTYAS